MQLSQFTKIISDETRLRLLMLLVNGEELCVCQLKDVLKLSQPKISRHLAILREAEILQDRKSGLWVYYRLNTNVPDWIYKSLKILHKASLEQAPYSDDLMLVKSSNVKALTDCN